MAESRRVLVAVVVIGIGLALAPLAFRMFDRAPEGGRMIEQFRPYMTAAKIDAFRGYLDEIGAAEAEVRTASLAPEATGASTTDLHRRWPTIDEDMGEMLDTMRANISRFRGVSALPPFVLFPWFFVIPGVLAAILAVAALRALGPHARARWSRALVVLGVGLLAAPAIFQMFTRAPGGAAMIDDFRPLMTDERVAAVQGYFLTLGAAEGELRTGVLSTAAAGELPAVRAWSADWPHISNEMAPMIGTMADNVDNFAAVDALPPFWLFPWFFVLPGLAVAALGVVASRARPAAATVGAGRATLDTLPERTTA